MKKILFIVIAVTELFFTACSTQKSLPSIQNNHTPYKLQTSNLVTQKLYSSYKKWAGTPYCYGGEGHNGIDCSALVQKIYKEAFNLQLPRTTKEQLKVGKAVHKNDLKEGDLLFFKTSYKALHTGIYLEKGNFIHASSKYGVKISNIRNSYWRKNYYLARRLF